MQKGFIIAIDGPVASGKGTIAPVLAKQLNGFYLYTGATYRCVALYCLENDIDVTNGTDVTMALPDVHVDLVEHKVFLNNKDVTERIKEVDVARAVSKVAMFPAVRERMVARQQEIAHERIEKGQIIVVEGRDTATIVFPDAELKVFLTAETTVRAQRRFGQFIVAGERTLSLQQVLEDIQLRDKEDTQRSADPLVTDPQNHGYFLVDNSYLSEAETVQIIVDELERRKIL